MIYVKEREELNTDGKEVWKTPKPSKSNITKERAAVTDLTKDNNNHHPTDKGKSTVIIDFEEYHDKVRAMLSDENNIIYEKVALDPTTKYKKKHVAIWERLKLEGKLTDASINIKTYHSEW